MANDIGPLSVSSNDIGPLNNNDDVTASGPDAPTGLALQQSGARIRVALDKPDLATVATRRIERRKDGGAWGTVDTVSVTPSFTPANAASTIGTNLLQVVDYDSSVPFVDIWKSGREWIPSNADGSTWDTGIPLTLRSDGYPASLSATESARKLLVNSVDVFPSGTYHIFFDGEGTFQVQQSGATSLTEVTTGHWTVNIASPSTAGIYFLLTDTNASDPLRNVRFVMPGHESTYTTAPFNPDFLSQLAKFKALRFAAWWEVSNDTGVSDYADIPTVDSISWASEIGGPPAQILCKLCNALSADMWLCIPYAASDACVTAIAEEVLANLDDDLHVYLEYTNEHWNGGFAAQAYLLAQANADGDISGTDWQKWNRWYARRAGQIFTLWDTVWAAKLGRRTRVGGTQSANSGISTDYLAFEDSYLHFDVLSPAPYIYDNRAEATILAGDESDVLTELTSDIASSLTTNTATQKAIADGYSLDLLAYEGGQHLVATGYSNAAGVDAIYYAAARDAGMGVLFKAYYDAWRAVNGNKLFMHFAFCGLGGQSGYWGLMHELGDTSVAKYADVLEWIDENPTYYLEDTLTATGTYDYRVVDIDGSANESAASTSTQVVFGTDDLKPLYFTATKDGSDVDLAWLAVGGADSYIVQRSPNGTDTWTQIATPTSASATDTNPGTGTWYYRVAAVVDAITGDWSDIISVTYLDANTNTATASITLPSLGITASAEVSSSPGQIEISATADITLPSLGITASANNQVLPGIPSSINVYLEAPNIKIEWGAATSAVSYTVEMDLASSGYSELSSGITSPLSATVAYPGVGTQRFRVYATNPNGDGGTIQGFLYTAPVTPSFMGTGRGFLGKSLLELKLSL